MTVRESIVDSLQRVMQVESLLEGSVASITTDFTNLKLLPVDQVLQTRVYEFRQRLASLTSFANRLREQHFRLLDPNDEGFLTVVPPPPYDVTPFGIIPRVSGLSNYNGSGVQSVAKDAVAQVANDRTTVNETQKPADIATFYDGNLIPGRQGDGILGSATMIVTPTTPDATYIEFWIETGAGNRNFAQRLVLTGGWNTPQRVTFLFAGYMGQFWAANGGRVMCQPDGDVDLSLKTFTFTRTHKAV